MTNIITGNEKEGVNKVLLMLLSRQQIHQSSLCFVEIFLDISLRVSGLDFDQSEESITVEIYQSEQVTSCGHSLGTTRD